MIKNWDDLLINTVLPTEGNWYTMDYIINKLSSFEWTGTMGLILYWLPLAICALGYIVRTVREVSNDISNRQVWEKWSLENPNPDRSVEYSIRQHWPKEYEPKVTVGTILVRAISTVAPILNLWCAIVDVAVIHRLFSAIGRFFSQPLVPKK